MKKDLKQNWGIEATSLYDRPLESKLKKQIDADSFFKKYNLKPIKKDELLLVSSTSWTKD
jgi:hypothetical protein